MRQRVALLLLCLPVSACDCTTVSTAKVKPSLSMPAADFAWGDIAVGSAGGVKSVTLTALSTAEITVSTSVEGDPTGVFSFQPAAPTIVPGRGTATISMNFTPTAAMPYMAVLVVTTNDPNPDNAVHKVPLSGIGDVPQLTWTPNELGFSAVACPPSATSARCSDTESVTLTNPGIVPVTLNNLSIVANGSNPVPANLNLATNLNTMMIAPMQSVTVPVLWQPAPMQATTGNFTANLQIQSNATANPTILIALNAQALPAQAPKVCVNVLSVEQRQYTESMGQPVVGYASVPQTLWEDMSTPPLTTTIHVRPGWQVSLTSLPTTTDSMGNITVNTAMEQTMPCTFDPQDLPLTLTWTLAAKPMSSRTTLMPTLDDGVMGADGDIAVDAVGTYTINFTALNTLGLSTTTSFTLDAVPQDDLLATAVWTTQVGSDVDLDIHLLVDSGPGVTGMGSLFCDQDCFFYNPDPTWFTNMGQPLSGSFIPTLLYDDQGNPGGLPSTETVDLITAPQPPAFASGSTFRVAVYYFSGSGNVTPTVTIQHLGTTLATYTATQALMNPGDVWYAAQVNFTPAACGTCTTSTCDCTPTVTELNTYDNVPFPTPPMTLGAWGACP